TRAPGIVYTTRKDLASIKPSGLVLPLRISTAGLVRSLSPEMELEGSVNLSSTPSPAWRTPRSLIVAGTGGEGGTGSPGAPQPTENKNKEKRKQKMVEICVGRLEIGSAVPFLFSIFQFQKSEDVAAQILVLDDVRELFGNVSAVNLHVLFLQVRRFEGIFVEYLFEDGVKAAGADIFGLLVYVGGEARDGGDRVFGDVELHPFRLEQRDILLDKRILRFGQNADEIFFFQRLQLDANGQPALKFGDQIRRFGDVKRASRDKQNVVGADHPVARVNRGAFDDGKNVALHAF